MVMLIDLDRINSYIDTFAQLIKTKKTNSFQGELKVGVDLGTANIGIAVLDQMDKPVAGAMCSASVVKDGLVVDFVGAVKIVRELKKQLEERLGVTLYQAATAVPPGTTEGNVKAFINVVESADMEVINVVDEPTAAAKVLKLTDGAVVDVGGGTTGISLLKNGKVIYTADEPTGGTHMTLVVAGNGKISFEEADQLKKDEKKQNDLFYMIKPVIQKMASIVEKHLAQFDVSTIYIVGGASCFSGFENVFHEEIGMNSVKPAHPLLITPLGIAMHCKK